MSINRRLFTAAAATSLANPSAFAAADGLVLAINEGVTYKSTEDEVRNRLSPLTDALSKRMKTKVTLKHVPRYDELAAGLKAGAYDVAFVHPTHYAAKALMGDYRLAAVSRAHMEYRANFLVTKTSPLNEMADLAKLPATAKIYLPDQDSITAWLGRASLKEAAASQPQLLYTRYQDAIRMFVENRLCDVGVVASAAEVRAWREAGHRVLGSTRAAPVKQWLVHKRLQDSGLEQVREVTTAANEAMLSALALPAGFAALPAEPILALGQWLGVTRA